MPSDNYTFRILGYGDEPAATYEITVAHYRGDDEGFDLELDDLVIRHSYNEKTRETTLPALYRAIVNDGQTESLEEAERYVNDAVAEACRQR